MPIAILVFLSVCASLVPWPAWAAGNQSVNTLPGSGTAVGGWQSYMRDELPAIVGRMFPDAWVESGGTHATAGSCTSAAFATEAFTTAGNRVLANSAGTTAAIDYNARGCDCANPATDVAWVIASASTDDTLANFVREPGTNYFVDCTSATEPSLPANSVWLMRVGITNGAIDKVTRLFSMRPHRETGIYNVKDYGAVGENTTHDDAIPIQRAITAACAGVYGGVVEVPPGLYRAYTADITINCPSKGMTLRGHGLSSAILGYATGRLILVSSDDVLIEKISLQGTASTTILIDVNDDGSGGNFRLLTSWLSGGTTYGVKLNNSIVPYIAGNVISSIASGAYGLWCAGGTCNGVTIMGNRFDGVAGSETGRKGMYITNANTVTIVGNVIEALEIGIELDGGRGFSILGNYFEGNCRSLTSVGSQNVAGVVEGNTFNTAPACGIVDIDLSNSVAWRVSHNYSQTVFGYGAAIRITAGGVTGSVFGPNNVASAAEVGPAGAVTPTNTYCAATSGICIKGTLSTTGLGNGDFAFADEWRIGANSVTASSGNITIKSGSVNNGNSSGWIPVLLNDGTRVYIPYIINPQP